MQAAPSMPLIPVTIASKVTIWVWGGYAIWQGAGIADGGIQRWSSPAFVVLRQVDNPTVFWGTTLIVLGCLTLAGSALQMVHRVATAGLVLKIVGVVGIAVWSFCFGLGAQHAATTYDTIPTTGGPTYFAIGLSVLVLAFIDERRPARV